MDEKTLTTLKTSREPRELQKAALALARSNEADPMRTLREFLRSAEFLDRLDSEADYQSATGRRLRISRVVEAIATNRAASATPAYIALLNDPVFVGEEERINVLIEEGRHIRPAPPELIAFWDKYSQPEDGYTPLTITALVKNGSEPALRLLEKKLADPAHEDEVKIAWMRTRILAHRNDVPLLQCCFRVLQGGLSPTLKPALVEVLFDYKGEWYLPATAVNPPSPALATAIARAELRKIGELALRTIDLPEPLKLRVKATVAAFDKEPGSP